MGIPDGLVRCGQCGELRGKFLYQGQHDPKPGLQGVRCLCEGIVCRYCKTHAIHRPISEYFDERAGIVYHVNWLGYLARCPACRRRQRRKEMIALARRRPWTLVANVVKAALQR